MVTPTMSVRALPEHHQLIRRMARALMERPELAESLTALIEGVVQDVTQGVTRPDTSVDQRFEDIEQRIAQIESQGVLRGDTPDVLREVQGVVQALQEHLMRQEQTTLKYVAMTENLSDRVRDLERPADPQRVATQPVQHTAVTQQPRQTSAGRGAGGGNKRLTDEQDLRIADMLKAGRSYSEIAASVDVSKGALSRIRDRLERQGLLTVDDQPVEPVSHIDENPE
jgi:hypothetical protein